MYLFIDIETTGLLPAFHEVIEIAVVICDSRLNTTATHYWRVIPERLSDADQTALAMNGFDAELWESTGISKSQAASNLRKVFDEYSRHIIVGHHPTFDLSHVQELMSAQLIDATIFNPIIDTRAVGLETFAPFGMKSTSLPNIRFFCYWRDPNHQAMPDALTCRRIMIASKRSYLNNALRLIISKLCDTIGIPYSAL